MNHASSGLLSMVFGDGLEVRRALYERILAARLVPQVNG